MNFSFFIFFSDLLPHLDRFFIFHSLCSPFGAIKYFSWGVESKNCVLIIVPKKRLHSFDEDVLCMKIDTCAIANKLEETFGRN